MTCNYCNTHCIKKGKSTNTQRYFCKGCKRYQQKEYIYKRLNAEDETMIVKLNNEGLGISSIARIIGSSKSNIINKIHQIASSIQKPLITEHNQEYEVDEMHTFIKSKNQPCYITYALNKTTKQVMDFVVGKRTKEHIGKVIHNLTQLNPKRIFTDKLNVYPGLIAPSIHIANAYKINHIERFNLTLRTHLKRLSRKTICFSKSKDMLENCLRIYMWKPNSRRTREFNFR